MSTPGTAPFLIPAPELTDAANIETAIEPLRDRIEVVLAQMLVPIGGLLAYAGSGDPAGGSWLLADGRLVDKTTYATYFTAVGHAYNGGVDPGSNMVRLPDKRGRSSIGADNMGTTQGAAGRLPNSNRVRGQNGGEERHTLTTTEIPKTGFVDENNNPLSLAHLSGGNTLPSGGRNLLDTTGYNGGFLQTAAGNGPHNNLHPYEVDNMIVRVA